MRGETLSFSGCLAAAAVLAALATAGMAEDIDAGPIWSNLDAQNKCPGVCSSAGGTWKGNWTTTAPGQNSVCSATSATALAASHVSASSARRR